MKTATKKPTATKRKGKHGVIEREWGGIPVEDATRDLRIIIKPCDVSGAERKDPSNCVFARACRRSFGTKKIIFLRNFAYVELPGEDGTMKVERFEMPPSVKRLIADFDKGGEIIPKGGFLLRAPSPSNTLEVKRYYDDKRRKRAKEAYLKGEKVTQGRTRAERPTVAKSIDLEVRNGRGMVHFH